MGTGICSRTAAIICLAAREPAWHGHAGMIVFFSEIRFENPEDSVEIVATDSEDLPGHSISVYDEFGFLQCTHSLSAEYETSYAGNYGYLIERLEWRSLTDRDRWRTETGLHSSDGIGRKLLPEGIQKQYQLNCHIPDGSMAVS
jgi:hypothetical protein